ncbi:MAG: nucleotide pyrophosphohydrolase [Desulfobulbus propionicus]|nr:MAG: nucleotide pyrophosphohydrolase [Desulfobulbus propionicus]
MSTPKKIREKKESTSSKGPATARKSSNTLPSSSYSLAPLVEIVRTLRGPGGCPWDARQTPKTLVKYLEEEGAELVEAIQSGDTAHVCEEWGDLLFILVSLLECFENQQAFTFTDALEKIVAKMIRRHPHVFGNAEVTDEQSLREQWQRIKTEEKQSP